MYEYYIHQSKKKTTTIAGQANPTSSKYMPQQPKTFANNMNKDTKIRYVQVSPQIPAGRDETSELLI